MSELMCDQRRDLKRFGYLLSRHDAISPTGSKSCLQLLPHIDCFDRLSQSDFVGNENSTNGRTNKFEDGLELMRIVGDDLYVGTPALEALESNRQVLAMIALGTCGYS